VSKRAQFYNYYRKTNDEKELLRRLVKSAAQRGDGETLLTRSSSSTSHQDRISYKGEATVHGVVVRCDLNGYSTWARERTLRDRAQLLDDFFSWVFSALEYFKGVYFRDEGDCLVAIFSSYFEPNATYQQIRHFCSAVVGRTYGKDELTAKAIVSCGQIAIFQKNHELGTDDWSAEGEPFVLAARVEQAIKSEPKIYYFKKDYDAYFSQGTSFVMPGDVYYWAFTEESHVVKGIGKVAGREDFCVLEHIPNGRTS
jgi:hypothetical protein